MKNVFCTGVTPFLNMCASGILEKNTRILYLTHIEKKGSIASKKELKDMNMKKKFISDIAFFFKYKVVFQKLLYPQINEGDMISGNLLRYLLPYLNGHKVIIFPEGASCINSLFKKDIKKKFLSLSYRLFKKLTVGSYEIKKRWILPDRDLKSKIIIDRFSVNELISNKKFFSNIQKCSKFFVHKYPELNLCKERKIIFHPINQYLNLRLYKTWIEKNKNLIGNKKLIVKSHENDYRDYKKVFKNFNCVIVPKKFITLPAELIIDNFKTHYLGYYSSIMLHFKRRDISFIIPPDKKLIKISNNEFFGIKNLMNLE